MLIIQTAPAYQPEKEYACFIFFQEILQLPYRIEYHAINTHRILLPNGQVLNFEDRFQEILTPDQHRVSALFAQALGMPHFALSEAVSSIPDLFALAFFLLSRLEETDTSARDAHGRFPAKASIAWKMGFLDRPVVNEWANWLWEALVQSGWTGAREQRKFNISISCDVDHPRLWWSNADRLKTLAGAIFKRGDWNETGYWLKNYTFRKKDPYDIFEKWLDLFEQNNLVAQFNFMGERARHSDCWYPLQHPEVKKLIHYLVQRGHRIGFHPSYESFENPALFTQELSSLQAITPIEITAGRQHYLRFSNPKTWATWEAAGLMEDSTLGYPEQEGFRCGICHDFPVFDIHHRKRMQLREKPLLAMDVTLAQYQKYTPSQAQAKLAQLRHTVEKYGGDFTLLWHNSSWNTPFWEDWKPVFQTFIAP